MSAINLQLVREFFELHNFRVLTNWHQDSGRSAEADAQLFVENCQPEPDRPRDTLLRLEDISTLQRAVVEVRAWHGDRVYASVVENNPILTQFLRGPAQDRANEIFRGHPYTTILVVSELPPSPEQRARTLERIQRTGLGHLLEFPTILHGLIGRISVTGDYDASATLALLRLLKRYRMVRNMQLEFPFPAARADAPRIDATIPPIPELPDEDEDEDEA